MRRASKGNNTDYEKRRLARDKTKKIKKTAKAIRRKMHSVTEAEEWRGMTIEEITEQIRSYHIPINASGGHLDRG